MTGSAAFDVLEVQGSWRRVRVRRGARAIEGWIDERESSTEVGATNRRQARARLEIAGELFSRNEYRRALAECQTARNLGADESQVQDLERRIEMAIRALDR